MKHDLTMLGRKFHTTSERLAKIGAHCATHPVLRDWNHKPEGCWGKHTKSSLTML